MPGTTQLHPATAAILRYFEHRHLPEPLQVVSAPFGELAQLLAVDMGLAGPELTAGLRHLLEAKDCAVRAALDVPVPLVAEMARDRITQTLHLNVRVPDGMSPEAVATLVAQEVQAEMAKRSAAERSQR